MGGGGGGVGGGGKGSGLSPEKSQILGFLARLVRIPWKITKLPN